MSYQEIKTLFQEEIKKTEEWQEMQLLNSFIIQNINEPNISISVIYNFSKKIDIDIFKLCFMVFYGFQPIHNINEFQ